MAKIYSNKKGYNFSKLLKKFEIRLDVRSGNFIPKRVKSSKILQFFGIYINSRLKSKSSIPDLVKKNLWENGIN